MTNNIIQDLKELLEKYETPSEPEQKKENPYGLVGDESYSVNLGDVTFNRFDDRGKLQEALNTWLELLSCEGVEAKSDENQFLIYRDVAVFESLYKDKKLDSISPAFDTEESAQKAIDKIGEDRLRKMFLKMGGNL